MSKVQNPIIGRAKGQAGGMVFQTWKGKNIMRARPLPSDKPSSTLQLAQQAKMRGVTTLLKCDIASIRKAFKEVAITVTEANAFVAANIKFISSETENVRAGQEHSLVLSRGSLRGPVIVGVTATTALIQVPERASEILLPTDDFSDKLIVAVYNTDTSLISYHETSGRRDDTTPISVIYPNLDGTHLDVFAFYQSADGQKNSNSVFVPHA